MRRRRAIGVGTTVAAFVFAVALFDIASSFGWRRDLSLGALPEPGAEVRSAVGGLADPVDVLLFFEPRDPVLARLRPWLDSLGGEQLRVRRVDRLSDPELARRHEVGSEGTVVVARGGERGASLVLGTSLARARRTLRRLDDAFVGLLAEAVDPPRLARFVQGHGEPSLRDSPARLVDLLRRSRFEPVAWDLRLPLEPGDGDLVVLLAPAALAAEEQAKLAEFLSRGGRALIALEPDGEAPAGLLRALGARARAGVVRARDGRSTLRARASAAHPTTESVAAPVPVESALAFARVGGRRSVAPLRVEQAFVDADGDGVRGEHEALANLAISLASTFQRRSGGADREGRAFVLGDGDLLSDASLARPGPEALLRGIVGWLAEEERGRRRPIVATAQHDLERDHAGGDARSVFLFVGFGIPLLFFVLAVWQRRRA